MKDSRRITVMLEQLERAWRSNPKLRLAQLIVNALAPLSPCPEVYAAEDGRLWRGLTRIVEQSCQPRPRLTPKLEDVEWRTFAAPGAQQVRFEGVREGFLVQDELVVTVLELRFEGVWPPGLDDGREMAFMAETLAIHLHRHEPGAVLMDLRGLDYPRGGYGMLRLKEVLQRHDLEHPLCGVWIGGPRSVDGLRSMFGEAVVFEEREAAVAEVFRVGLDRAWKEALRG